MGSCDAMVVYQVISVGQSCEAVAEDKEIRPVAHKCFWVSAGYYYEVQLNGSRGGELLTLCDSSSPSLNMYALGTCAIEIAFH